MQATASLEKIRLKISAYAGHYGKEQNLYNEKNVYVCVGVSEHRENYKQYIMSY